MHQQVKRASLAGRIAALFHSGSQPLLDVRLQPADGARAQADRLRERALGDAKVNGGTGKKETKEENF